MRYVFFLLVLALATTAVADGLSYTTMTAGVHNGYNSNAGIPFIPETDALTFFSAEAVFDATCPGLVTEDFSSTLVPPNSVLSDAGAINYDTDNTLFALHTVVQGISLWEQASGDMVVLTPPFAGVTSVTVGPNIFTDDAVITFSASTNAFGAYIVMPNGGDIVNIEVFGASGSLGTTSMTGATGGGAFWGVFCDSEDITSITFDDPNDAGELFANVKFGAVTALSRTTWADIKVSF